MPDTITCHLTRNEQIALSKALNLVECRGRIEREQKVDAFEALGLEWVRKVQEKPVTERVSSDEVADYHQKLTASGASPAEAIARVMTLVQGVLQADPFAGEHAGQTDVTLTPRMLAWVLEKLDKAAPCGADDLVIAAVEARLRLAERGAYIPPSPAPAPTPDESGARPS